MLQRGQGLLGRLAGTAVRAIVPARSVTATSAAAADVSTRVQYVKRQDKKDLFYYAAPPPEEVGRITNLEPESVVVRLEDLRNKQQMQWQRNGFELIQFPGVQSVCWDDKDQVKLVYASPSPQSNSIHSYYITGTLLPLSGIVSLLPLGEADLLLSSRVPPEAEDWC